MSYILGLFAEKSSLWFVQVQIREGLEASLEQLLANYQVKPHDNMEIMALLVSRKLLIKHTYASYSTTTRLLGYNMSLLPRHELNQSLIEEASYRDKELSKKKLHST